MSDTETILNAVNGIGQRVDDQMTVINGRITKVEDAIVALARIEAKHEALDDRANETSKRVHHLEQECQVVDKRVTSLESSRKYAAGIIVLVVAPVLGGIGTSLWRIMTQLNIGG